MILFHWTFLLLIPPLLFAMWAQWKVKSTYNEFSQRGTRSGLTGAEVAAGILREAGIRVANDPGQFTGPACAIEPVQGELTDHYDPREQTLRLSQGVYGSRSIAALGIAAHEAGHAIQHANSYTPLHLRSVIYPVSSIGSTLAFPLFFAGIIIPQFTVLMDIAIFAFTFAVLFTLITLPVEFNASKRALAALESGGRLTTDEMDGARQVLHAAAMTYVASAAMAAMQLLRMVILRGERD